MSFVGGKIFIIITVLFLTFAQPTAQEPADLARLTAILKKSMETTEKRNLIAVNGKKTNIQDSSLQTVMFQYKNVLFGPVGLLSKSWQGYFDYKLIGEDSVNKEKAVVIEATPGLALTEPHVYGRLWAKGGRWKRS